MSLPDLPSLLRTTVGRMAGSLLLAAVLLAAGPACWAQDDGSPSTDSSAQTGDRPVVEVVAADSALQVTPSVPSGWVTFRMTNEGTHHHSFKLEKLPSGTTFDDYRKKILVPADSLEEAVLQGRIDSSTYGKEMRKRVPPWFGRVFTAGGITGLAPGRTARITLDLEPGQYILSCLFKTPNNRTHALVGVRSGFTVTDDSSGASPPTADVEVQLSRDTFAVDESALSEKQTLAFRAEGRSKFNGSPFVGLFRLTDETDVDGVLAWMQNGIPLPAPVEWIGGPEPMPPGDVGYVHVGDLPPGRYAWVTELAPQADDMVKTFTVAPE